jgi:site-specific DNA recombinase
MQDKLAVVYCRVSTEGQEQDGTSLDTQADACRTYAGQQGYTVLKVVLEARSGANLNRPGLDEVLDIVERGEVSAVIIYKLDRLSRETGDTLTLLKAFQKHGVELKSATVPIDSTPEGELLLTMLAAIGKFERTQIGERTRRGKARRAREGRVLPGPKITFGYDYSAGQYTVNEAEAAVVRMIFALLTEQGLSCNSVANRLTDALIPTPKGGTHWLRSTVHRILSNEAYVGAYNWGKYESILPSPDRQKKDSRERKREKSAQRRRDVAETIAVTIPAIIERATFDAAQERLRKGKANSPRNERHPYLLRSMIFCAKCGRRYAGQFTHGTRVYTCPSNQSYNKAARCGSRQYQADVLEEAVWTGVMRRFKDPDSLLESMSKDDMELEQELDTATLTRLEAEEADIRRKDQRNKEAYQGGVLSLEEWKEERDPVRKRLDEIAAMRAAIEEREATRRKVSADEEQIARLRSWLVWRGAMPPSFDEKRLLLEKLQACITVDRERALLTGLITETILDLDFAAEKVRLQRQAWDERMSEIDYMRATGRVEDADKSLQMLLRGRANGTLILSITPPPGATIVDDSVRLAAFMSTSSP